VRWVWLLVLVLPCTARAQSVHLQWAAPAASMCPNRATLSADVENLTGLRFVRDAAAADVRIVGHIEESALGVDAQIEAHTADGTPIGTRELHAGADECASLRRPLALVLALLIEQPRPPHRATYALGVELAADTHLMPRTVGGLGLVAFVTPLPRLALRAQGNVWLPLVAETTRGTGARLKAFGGALSLCPQLVAGSRLALWACLGAQAGGVFASPRGLSTERSRTLPFVDLLTELAGSWRAGRRVALWLSGGPLFALARPELYFERADGSPVRVQRASPVGVIFRLALTIGRD
jgi:hypothetical protein